MHHTFSKFKKGLIMKLLAYKYRKKNIVLEREKKSYLEMLIIIFNIKFLNKKVSIIFRTKTAAQKLKKFLYLFFSS